jgi:hypothetical protein
LLSDEQIVDRSEGNAGRNGTAQIVEVDGILRGRVEGDRHQIADAHARHSGFFVLDDHLELIVRGIDRYNGAFQLFFR